MIKTIFLFAFFLIINLFILYTRLWLFNNIFKLKNRKKLLFIIIVFWLINWWTILFYPHFLSLLKLTNFDFSTQKLESLNNINSIIIFRLWLTTVIIISFFLINFKKIRNKIFWTNWIIFSLFFLILWYFFTKFITNKIFLYYIYVWLWEEYSKFLLATILFIKFWKIKNDILLFSILTAMWFSFTENFVYLLWWISNETLLKILLWWLTILLTRWLIGFLVHIIFTGNIWYFNMLWRIKNKVLYYIPLWILIWTTLHYLYDVGLTLWYNILLPIVLIIWYIWISYLFYNSDRIYAQYKNTI